MSKQWKDRTRGGLQYRIKGQDAEFKNLIRGEVYDAGLTIPLYWTEGGRIALDGESPYDLIPIEPEASPAKVRVDLALAAHSWRAAVLEFQRAKDAKDKAGEALFDAFAASKKTEAVVKIDGEHYLFWTENAKVRFRKIEVL
jgi:YHS domain-containing protein